MISATPQKVRICSLKSMSCKGCLSGRFGGLLNEKVMTADNVRAIGRLQYGL